MSLEVAFSLGGRVVLPAPFREYAHLRRTLVASYYKRRIPSHMSKSHRRFLAIVCKHLRASPDIFLSRSSATLAHASSKPRSIGEPDDPIIRESRGVSRSTDLIIRQSTPVFGRGGRGVWIEGSMNRAFWPILFELLRARNRGLIDIRWIEELTSLVNVSFCSSLWYIF